MPLLNSGFQLRPYKEVKLNNGLRVLLVEDKTLPYTTFTMMVGVGSAQDPQKFSGLSNFVGEMLTKGTQKRNAIQIADFLGQMGAMLDVNTDLDYTQIIGSSLSMHRDELLEIFSEVVTNVSFSENEIRRLKRQIQDVIKKTAEDPESFASMAFQDYIYSGHPYAQPVIGKSRDVNAIRKKNIIKHYLTYYRPNNATLAVVGNYGDDIIAKLEKALGAWKPKDTATPTFSALPELAGLQLKVIDKSDLVQSQIRIGHYGIRRNTPDFLKLRVANSILGGGFASRLMQEIRVKSGLTYGIHSALEGRRDVGPFAVSTFTRNDKVGETVKKTIDELNKFREQGVSSQEVADAKALLIGGFPRAIETAEKLAFNLMILRLYGISDDYLKNFIKDVENISVADVNETIKKYFKSPNLKVLIYSNAKSVEKQLAPLGTAVVKPYRDYL